ncbi:MAG TPA: amino acid permease [Victivallales bacterium]|nr:amino acid permease [Victivallales bacterium]
MSTEHTGKKIGAWILTFFVAGTIVGSGVYMLPASLAGYGSIGLVSWIVTAIGAVFLALVFAKLGSVMPANGGPYAYSHAEFGDFVGFQTAYCYWLTAWVGNISYIPATIGYLAFFFPHVTHYSAYIGVGLLWLFGIINMIGVKNAGIVAVITTIFKFIPLIIVVALGWAYFHPSYLSSSFNISGGSTVSAFTIAAALTLWSFLGVEAATVPAGSVKNAKRNIPLATIIGTLSAAALYIITCALIMGMIPMKQLSVSTFPFSEAGKILLGSFGGFIITFGALFSLLGAINSWTLLGVQATMSAAEDGLFPKVFGKRNKFGVPGWGIFITTLVSSVLYYFTSYLNLIKQFEIFILAATSLAVIAYLYTCIAEIVFLYKNKMKITRVKINIFIAVIGALFSIFAIASSSVDVVYFVMILLLISIPLYGLMVIQKNKDKNKQSKQTN